MYQEGTAFEFEGKKLDTCIVNDKEQEDLKLESGWFLNPSLKVVIDYEKENEKLRQQLEEATKKQEGDKADAVQPEEAEAKETVEDPAKDDKKEVKEVEKPIKPAAAYRKEGNRLPKGIK